MLNQFLLDKVHLTKMNYFYSMYWYSFKKILFYNLYLFLDDDIIIFGNKHFLKCIKDILFILFSCEGISKILKINDVKS